MPDLSRRGLLKATATAGVGAIALPGIAAAKDHPVVSAATGGAENAAGGSAKLTGRIVRPGDPEYPVASLGWDELFVHYPLVIVFAQETQDVVNALAWARQNDVALRVRSGRHSLEGWSNVDNGIVIDVSELKSVQINNASGIAKVAARPAWQEATASSNRRASRRGVPRLFRALPSPCRSPISRKIAAAFRGTHRGGPVRRPWSGPGPAPRPRSSGRQSRWRAVAAVVIGLMGPSRWSGTVPGKISGSGGDDDPGQIQRVNLHVLAGLRGLDDLAAAEVHHDVARVGRGAVRAGGEQQVTGLDLRQRDGRAVLAPLKVVRPMAIPAAA